MDDLEIYAILDKTLGYPGGLLSGSKRNPPGTEDHTIYWNACVFLKTGRKDAEQIWHGDLDVTAQEATLQDLARQLKQTIYVTPEQPWRFDGFRATMKRDDHRKRVIEFQP